MRCWLILIRMVKAEALKTKLTGRVIITQASPGSGHFPQSAGYTEQLSLSSQRPSSPQTEPMERKKENAKQKIF